MSWCNRITDKSLEYIGYHLKLLNSLIIASCNLIKGTGIKIISENCIYLQKLELRGCTNIQNLEIHSNSLKILNLSNCLSLLDDAIFSNINCTSLQELFLSSCLNIKSESIKNLLQKSKFITNLDLSYCNLKDIDLSSNELIMLNLTGCRNFLYVQSFEKLAKNCTNLKIIFLKSCFGDQIEKYNNLSQVQKKYLSADSVVDFLTKSSLNSYSIYNVNNNSFISNIETIDLSRCDSLTDEGVRIIMERCIFLKSLDISWCTKLTDKSIVYISNHIFSHYQEKKCSNNKFYIKSHFQLLKVFGCIQISSLAIQQLQKNYKYLTIKCIMV